MPASKKFWLVAVITLIGLVAAQPMLRLQLVFQLDTMYHLQRVAQVEAALRYGSLFPRFSPDLAYGFGYPILNYYAPLLYYLIAPVYLAGLPIVATTAIVCSLIFVLGAWGMFKLASPHMSQASALIAAASFVLAPYVISNTLTRGALAEHLGLALAPWALHSVYRVSRTHSFRSIALYAIPIAALLISHNLSAALTAGLMAAYALYVLWMAESPRTAAFIRIASTVALALLLAAFFWLPVVLEGNLVQLNLIYLPSWSDVRNNLVSAESQFQPPIVWDRLRQFDEDPSRISLFSQGLAALALGHLLHWRRNPQRAVLVAGCALIATLTLCMVFNISRPIWDVLTPLRVLQFPWRLLGPNALVVALLVGLACEGLRALAPRLFPALVTTVLAVTVLYIFPRQIISWPVEPSFSVDARETVETERTSGTIGTTIAGEFTPKAVRTRPPFEQSIHTPGNDRIWREALPPSVTLAETQFEPLRYTLRTNSPQPFTLSFRTFFFEGWRARIGNQDAAPFAVGPHGLLSIAVPAGEQAIQVWFGSTPARDIANHLSLLGALALITLLAFPARQRTSHPPSPHLPFSPSPLLLFTATLCALLALKTLWVDATDTPFAHSRFDGTNIAGISHPAQANFNNELVFMGADLNPAVPSGGLFKFNAFWRVPQPAARNLTVGAQLMDEQDAFVGQENHEAPGALQVTTFKVGFYVRDEFKLPVSPATPPGFYRLIVYAFPYQQPDQRLPLLQDGSIRGVSHEVARVTVQRPTQPAALESLTITQRLTATLAPGLVLAGYDLPTTQAGSGDRLPLAFYWQANTPLPPNQTFELLVNGIPLAAQPLVRNYDTQLWQAGDVWRGTHTLWLPPSLPEGEQMLSLRVASGQPVPLGKITIRAPQRQMTPPATTHTNALSFGAVAQLAGYDLPQTAPPGGTLFVRLVWRALGEGEASYKFFVHLLSADGANTLVASNDAIPAAWTRPTNTWLRGEYIPDERAIPLPANLPAGSYTVSVGLYDEQTGQRLPLPNGDTRATLGSITVK